VPQGVSEIAIDATEWNNFQNSVSDELLTNRNAGMPFSQLIQASVDLTKKALWRDDVKKVLDEKFDVIITLPFFANEVAYYLAHRTNSTLVQFVTAPFSMPTINYALGESYNPSFMPNALLFTFLPSIEYSPNMGFFYRCINTIATTFMVLGREHFILPRLEEMLAEVYPDENIPKLSELEKNSALFINHGTPFTGDGMRPVSPKTILAGLMSCSPAKPLPEDLEKYIKESPHGVIYVSFGSVVKASKMPESKRKAMLKVFSKLKQRIIWKWETSMDDAPSNVLISSWLPQTSLLAHSGVKLFVTHGGAGSVQETICHKTPIVGIPLAGDQIVNVKESAYKHIGVQVDWHEMTEESLYSGIMTVLEDKSYQDSVSQLSDLIMDQPQHPLERAIWWLEYLLRHPQNINMRPVVHHLSWAQYFLLDVLAFFLFVVLVVILLVWNVCKICFRRKPKQD